MFAKRQSVLAAQAGSPPHSRKERLMASLKARPQIVVGAAGLCLLGLVGTGVAVLGDPMAGLPTAEARLSQRTPAVDAVSGEEAFEFGGLEFYQDLESQGLDGEGAAGFGDALITLPDGANVSTTGTFSAPVRQPDPLPAAPIAGLHQPGPDGPLPRIATDGRVPAQAYARPFRSNGKPAVALVVGGLGLNAVTTRAAIERLPPEVTLSFVPYAEGLQRWIDMARSYGHEVLIELPMEPTGYPDNDPGPYTLLANSNADDVSVKLDWLLSRAVGYYGVTNYLGDRFMTSDAAVTSVMSQLRQRGLAFVDDGTFSRRSGAFARATADRVIDEEQSPTAILRQLHALEVQAKTDGAAMGSGFCYPVTVEVAARWIAGLNERGLQLAPASAMQRRARA
ncbi:divergent polysaccharide deacetylase family protein [uncultured Brevundimonas sp.]|uniref:divergent polysaccharide deacetylase family protein n=1 Tax=uncultured Brevundimonas sp. TaxID=213418 RepID=UPI0026150AC1|nr:divergent polysaccharide deacetylase family protein [uncultured Brevundimonas sp.]